MAKDFHDTQSSLEEKPYPIDWTDALPSGVTVSSLAATHTPPSGAAVTLTHDLTLAPITTSYVPSGLVVGVHTFSVVATTSNTKVSPEVRLIIRVDY